MSVSQRQTCQPQSARHLAALVAAGFVAAVLVAGCGGGGGAGSDGPSQGGGVSELTPSDTVVGGAPAPGGTASTGHAPPVIVDTRLY